MDFTIMRQPIPIFPGTVVFLWACVWLKCHQIAFVVLYLFISFSVNSEILIICHCHKALFWPFLWRSLKIFTVFLPIYFVTWSWSMKVFSRWRWRLVSVHICWTIYWADMSLRLLLLKSSMADTCYCD